MTKTNRQKADTLHDKMQDLQNSIGLAEEAEELGIEVIESVEGQLNEVKDKIPASDIINLNTMVDDFKYVRETLRENTDNAKRVLNSITFDLLSADEERKASLIMSFAELNKAVADNMKLYMQAYKDISNVLLNIKKIDVEEGPSTLNQTINYNGKEAISTVDLIQQLTRKTEKSEEIVEDIEVVDVVPEPEEELLIDDSSCVEVVKEVK